MTHVVFTFLPENVKLQNNFFILYSLMFIHYGALEMKDTSNFLFAVSEISTLTGAVGQEDCMVTINNSETWVPYTRNLSLLFSYRKNIK